MLRAAILDFEVEADEDLLTCPVRYLTLGGIPVEISDWEFGNFDFRVQFGKHHYSIQAGREVEYPIRDIGVTPYLA